MLLNCPNVYIIIYVCSNMKEACAKGHAMSDKNAQRLWDISMDMCGLNGPEQNGA